MPIPLYGFVLLWCVVLIPLCLVRKLSFLSIISLTVFFFFFKVRDLKYFSFTSIFGLVSLLFTIVSVITNGVLHSTPPDPIPLGPSDLFLFLGELQRFSVL